MLNTRRQQVFAHSTPNWALGCSIRFWSSARVALRTLTLRDGLSDSDPVLLCHTVHMYHLGIYSAVRRHLHKRKRMDTTGDTTLSCAHNDFQALVHHTRMAFLRTRAYVWESYSQEKRRVLHCARDSQITT